MYARAERSLWLKWLLANAAAAVIGDLPLFLVAILFEQEPTAVPSSPAYLFWWFLVLSAMQWLVLRPWIRRFRAWLLGTMAGLLLYLIAAALVLILIPVPDVWTGTIRRALLGASLGIARWKVLRRRFSGAGRWILAATAGWTAAGLMAQVSDGLLILALLAPGWFTGTALVRLVRREPGEGPKAVPPPIVTPRLVMQVCPHCGEQASSKVILCRSCRGWLLDSAWAADSAEKKPARKLVLIVGQARRRGMEWAAVFGAHADLFA